MNHSMKRCMCLLGVLWCGLLLSGISFAQSYPDKLVPLKVVIPFGAGTSADAVARTFAKAITEVAGLNVVVENKPGADSVIGLQSVINGPKDGYTLLVVSSSTAVLNPLMVSNQSVDILRDFVPLTAIAKNSPALNVGPSAPFKSVREFVAAAKADPGRFTYGSASTTSQLAGQLLEARTGIEMLNVPYKTTAAALTALAAGEVDSVFVDPGSAKGMYGTGRVKLLATAAPARLSAFPQVPTMAEEGIRDYQITSWFASYLPANTPPEKVNVMRAILTKAARTASYSEALAAANLEPFHLIGDDISTLTRAEIEMWRKILRDPTPRTTK